MQKVLDALKKTDLAAAELAAAGTGARQRVRPPRSGIGRAEILRRLQVERRLPSDERYEVERQVHNNEIHRWLVSHSKATVTRTELSRKQKTLLQGCFKILDVDGNGSIEFEELAIAMTSLGFTAADTKEAFASGNDNHDGKLDFGEFVQMFSNAWAHRESRTAFNDAFGRDMHDVVQTGLRPDQSAGAEHSDENGGKGARRRSYEEPDRVTTAFPFALVANSHRITKLVDACNPTVRESALPKISDKAGGQRRTRRRESRLPPVNKRRVSLPKAEKDAEKAAAAYTDTGGLPLIGR